MKTCELCGGAGHQGVLICAACDGTGLISLGHESADRYAQLKQAARVRAALAGWQEIVWEGEQPGPVRKVRRVITVDEPVAPLAMEMVRRG